MRALADGRVRWGFWPSGMGLDREGIGIWLEGIGTEHEMEDGKDGVSEVETAETLSEGGEDVSDDLEDEEAEEGDEQEKDAVTDDEEGQAGKGRGGGFFAALDTSSGEEVGTDEEDE